MGLRDKIKKTQLSRDLSGYITYLYSAPKIGKTTLCRDAGALIIATERGYNAVANANVVDALSWGDIRSYVRELVANANKKDPDTGKTMLEEYPMVAIDTVDIAAALCEKFICSQNGVETLGQLPYGQGWTLFKKEFEEQMRKITTAGYACMFISHDKEKQITRPDGTEYTKVTATASNSINEIIKGMADIIAYGYQDPTDNERYMMLRSLDGTVDAGCRFQYIKPVIKFSYKDLVAALNEAIDAEEQASGTTAVTTEKITYAPVKQYDYDAMMTEFNSIVGKLMETDSASNGPKITTIVNKTLGRGKKFSECTPDQVEVMEVVLDDIKAEFGL